MKKIKRSDSKKGFTMVEFAMATAFISILLIAVAIITTNIVALYQKGLAVKAVNSIGRGLVDELISGINQGPSVDSTSLCNAHLSATASEDARDRCIKDNASNFVFQHKMGRRVAPDNETTSDVQFGGIFCTGKYTYMWNTYYGHEFDRTALTLTYGYYDASHHFATRTLDDFRLIRFEDPTYRACSVMVDGGYNSVLYNSYGSGTTNIDISYLANGAINAIEEPTSGFLTTFDLDLELYELTIFPTSQDHVTLRTFMSGTFVLATRRGNINIERSGGYCDVKNLANDDTTSDLLDIGAEFNYCGINKFNFAARTAGY